MKKIFLLTGPKNSGKSTRLMNWVQQQDNVHGIVCPREKGKRELFSVSSKSFKEFEVGKNNSTTIKIGKFNFLKESFDWAETELLKSLSLKPNWVVIDEIGPLELQGRGFDKITKQLLNSPELGQTNLILVVRESIVDEVILAYNLDTEKIKIVDFI